MNAFNVQRVEVLATMTAPPEARVRLVVEMTEAEAESIAATRIASGGADLLADDAKPVANDAIADALVAAGMGQG